MNVSLESDMLLLAVTRVIITLINILLILEYIN